ncbi:hypothetical protein WDV93_14890 [Pantoea ananatis]
MMELTKLILEIIRIILRYHRCPYATDPVMQINRNFDQGGANHSAFFVVNCLSSFPATVARQSGA